MLTLHICLMRTALHLFQQPNNIQNMKRIIIISGIVLLTVNILFGLILSFFDNFNACVSSAVIIVTTLLLLLTNAICLKNGYKVSLFCLFSVLGIVEYALSLFAPNKFADNLWLIIVIVLIAIETILLLMTNTISKRI